MCVKCNKIPKSKLKKSIKVVYFWLLKNKKDNKNEGGNLPLILFLHVEVMCSGVSANSR